MPRLLNAAYRIKLTDAAPMNLHNTMTPDEQSALNAHITERERRSSAAHCSPASSTPNLDYLREQVTKLKMLLDDPHPGLATWAQMYGESMTAINDFWNAKPENVDMSGAEKGKR